MKEKSVFYTVKKYHFHDEKGRECFVRCAFDKDRFFIRSFSFIEDGKKYFPKLMKPSTVGSFEYKDKL